MTDVNLLRNEHGKYRIHHDSWSPCNAPKRLLEHVIVTLDGFLLFSQSSHADFAYFRVGV